MNKPTREITTYFKIQYDSHVLHLTIEKLFEDVRERQPQDIQNDTIEVQSTYYRLVQVLAWTQSVLTGIDPIFVPNVTLNTLNNIAEKIILRWNDFLANQQQWKPLNNEIEAFLFNLSQITKNSIDTNKISVLFDDYTQKYISLKKTTSTALQEYNAVINRLGALSNNINKQQALLDSIAVKHTEAFTYAQTQRVDDFNKTINTLRENYLNFIEEQKNKLAIEKLKDDFNIITEQQKTIFDTIIDNLNKKYLEAKEVVGTIVTTTMTGNYQKISDREYWSAWIMTVTALIMFVFMFYVMNNIVKGIINMESLNWQYSLLKFFVGLTLAIPATYCMRESSRHWSLEKEYRRMTLELSAIEPFIDRIADADIKKELLKRKADEYFGNKNTFVDLNDKEEEMDNTKLSINAFLEVFRQLFTIFSSKK